MSPGYQNIEEIFLRLIVLLASIFSESEISEVQDFIDVGEYGLALETLVDIIVEEDKQISSVESNLIYELVGVMQLDKGKFEDKLRVHVKHSYV